jgi:type II secretory pathway pseudopilin PulG
MQLSLVNHLGKQWISLIEIMAMIAVIWLAIAAMFSTVVGGIYFAKDSENRIKAINLAREGIEWVTNLRNTNWLRFSSDQTNCWKTKDYNGSCIWNPGALTTPGLSIATGVPVEKYILINTNGAWYISTATPTTGSGLWVDSDWYYVATGTTVPGEAICTIDIATNCRSPFTRELSILKWSDDNIITVTSSVDWNERRAQNVTLTTTLTNWKSKF